MSNFDLVSFVQTNINPIVSSVNLIATGVVSAVFLRRKSRIETQTQEFEKIRIGKLNEVLDGMLATGQISYMELYKISNYLDIAKRADEYIQSEKIKENMPKQDFDWHIRFFESCGNIGNEELQEYWAKILAGEIIQLGSYSYRTLECLKNLSADDAKLFQKICKASFDMGRSVILPQYDCILQEYEISFEDILKADDCGLIKSDNWINGTFEVKDEYTTITTNEEQALLVRNKDNTDSGVKKNITVREYLFTQSGKELYRMIGYQANLEILYMELKNQFPQYHFYLGKIVGREEGRLLIKDGDNEL